MNNFHGEYFSKLYFALDKGFKPEDCTKSGRATYLALDTVMRRAEEAFVLDKELLRRGWIKMQEEAGKQLALFTPEAQETTATTEAQETTATTAKKAKKSVDS